MKIRYTYRPVWNTSIEAARVTGCFISLNNWKKLLISFNLSLHLINYNPIQSGWGRNLEIHWMSTCITYWGTVTHLLKYCHKLRLCFILYIEFRYIWTTYMIICLQCGIFYVIVGKEWCIILDSTILLSNKLEL